MAVAINPMGDAVGLQTLIAGLVAFLIAAVLLTLLGFGGASGNATGLLFWTLLAVLAIALTYSRLHGGAEPVRLRRRARDRDRR